MSCETCPCKDICLAREIWCREWSKSGDEVKLRHICDRSRIAAGQPTIMGPGPSPAVMAANLGRALFDWAVSGFSMASDEERARRLAICGACAEWDGARCRICGCYTTYKVQMKTEHCPLPEPKW